MDKHKGIQFVGFSEALNDASDHLSNRLEKSLDLADNMYMTHGQDAVQAVEGVSDRDVAQAYADQFVQDQLSDEE